MPEITPAPTNPTPPPRKNETTRPMAEASAPDAPPPPKPAPVGGTNYPTILDAVNAGDVVWVLSYLYDHPDEANHASPENGWMPLHVAALNNDYRMADVLLRFGANPNEPNNAGKNALHDAAFKGFPEMVRLLLDHGADATLTYKEETASDRARRGGHMEVVALIELSAGELRA